MEKNPVFQVDDPEYRARWLDRSDTCILQDLLDRCPDYAEIVEGQGVSPTAAEELFESLPPGGSYSNKMVAGIIHPERKLVGVLEGMRSYPEQDIWWIGLLLLDPTVRHRWLGRRVAESFIEYAGGSGAKAVMLGVVEDNLDALHFWSQNRFALVGEAEPRQFGKKTQSVYVMRRNIMAPTPEGNRINA